MKAEPPYRELAERPEEPPPPEPSREERLGPLVAKFFPVPLWQALLNPFLLTLRNVTVALHRGGLCIDRRGRTTTILWDDIDEVWMAGDLKNGLLRITEVPLRLHDRTRVTVPLELQDATRLYNEIVRTCSTPLVSQALEALRRGETLTFGHLTLDANGMKNRWLWETPWGELTLVRFRSGEIDLYRGTRFFSWRTIDLRDIPHATVLVRIIREYAPKSENA